MSDNQGVEETSLKPVSSIRERFEQLSKTSSSPATSFKPVVKSRVVSTPAEVQVSSIEESRKVFERTDKSGKGENETGNANGSEKVSAPAVWNNVGEARVRSLSNPVSPIKNEALTPALPDSQPMAPPARASTSTSALQQPQPEYYPSALSNGETSSSVKPKAPPKPSKPRPVTFSSATAIGKKPPPPPPPAKPSAVLPSVEVSSPPPRSPKPLPIEVSISSISSTNGDISTPSTTLKSSQPTIPSRISSSPSLSSRQSATPSPTPSPPLSSRPPAPPPPIPMASRPVLVEKSYSGNHKSVLSASPVNGSSENLSSTLQLPTASPTSTRPPSPTLGRVRSASSSYGSDVEYESSVSTQKASAPLLPARRSTTTTSMPVVTAIAAQSHSASAPPLPARSSTKSSINSDASDDTRPIIPPPVPNNRPIVQPSIVSLPTPSSPRSRSGSGSSATAPALPVRSNTLASSKMSLSHSRGSNSSLNNRSSTMSVSTGGGSFLPPPPVRRTANLSDEAVHRDRPQKRDALVDNSDDEGDVLGNGDEAATLNNRQPLGTIIKKGSDDLPDATLSNRRPPKIRSQHSINVQQQVSSFAVSGPTLAVGSHLLRLYDIEGVAHAPPRLTMDQQRDTGLEVRLKDPKITALAFRPSERGTGEEARFVWCGSKDGHLWEVDTWTGTTTHSKSLAHPGPIAAILRYKNALASVDETGKMLIFCSPAGPDNYIPLEVTNPSQSQRISDKQSFIKMLGSRLWTSSGPTARSNSDRAVGTRGPSIRVYDPFNSINQIVTGKSLVVSEVSLGAVISGAIIPSRPSEVYLGHEGGHITIWDAESLTCTKVLKISASDILCLEGVGNRLWSGTRRGAINVMDVGTSPWTVTNTWQAHAETPVLGLQVDTMRVEKGYVVVYSWGRDDHVHAWDGLLAEDWIETQLLKREAEFCNFRELKVLTCSFNLAASRPMDLSSTSENASFLSNLLNSVESPDILIFGFQELIDLDDKKLTAKSLLFGKAKVGGSEMSDKVSSGYRLWHDKLVQAVRTSMPPDVPYKVIHNQNLVGLFTCIFVKASEVETIRDISVTTIKRGVGGLYGNKGAIVARFVIDDSSLCFINCHLAAGQRQVSTRNADAAGIFEEKALFPTSTAMDDMAYVGGGDGTMVMDHDICILQGDLNYRIDLRKDNVTSSIKANDRDYLLQHDQLLKEMTYNSSFRLKSFTEAKIAFNPTYKFDPGTSDYDSGPKNRVPAWCDRILYRSRVASTIKSLHYKSYGTVTISDHKPISAAFDLRVRSVRVDDRERVKMEETKLWIGEMEERVELAKAFYLGL